MIPTLTPAQRERQPLFAAVLDYIRGPLSGEDVLDLRPNEKRPRRSGHPCRAKGYTNAPTVARGREEGKA